MKNREVLFINVLCPGCEKPMTRSTFTTKLTALDLICHTNNCRLRDSVWHIHSLSQLLPRDQA